MKKLIVLVLFLNGCVYAPQYHLVQDSFNRTTKIYAPTTTYSPTTTDNHSNYVMADRPAYQPRTIRREIKIQANPNMRRQK